MHIYNNTHWHQMPPLVVESYTFGEQEVEWMRERGRKI